MKVNCERFFLSLFGYTFVSDNKVRK